MYFITTKRMLEVCFSVHPNIQYRTTLFYFLYLGCCSAIRAVPMSGRLSGQEYQAGISGRSIRQEYQVGLPGKNVREGHLNCP